MPKMLALTTTPTQPRQPGQRAARWLGLWLLAGLATVAGTARPTWAAPSEATVAASGQTDRLVLRYRGDSNRQRALAAPATSAATQASLHRAGLLAVNIQRRANGIQVVQLDRRRPVGRLLAAARQLMADDPSLLWAEPDYRMQAQAIASDPLFNQQWHYTEARAGINLPSAWDLSTGTGVNVAVIDTGVRPHADLAAQLLPGLDLISDLNVARDGDGRDSDASDPGDGCNGRNSSWHGTHVAGTVAAAANNGEGGTGVAPGAKIVPVRVLGCGGGYNSDIADGIVWAAGGNLAGQSTNPNPAKVLNLSLGGSGPCSATMQSAIDSARALGAVVVVAAGNSNAAVSGFSPANCRGVIAVGSVGRTAARAPYSNYGPAVDIAAPGGSMSTGAANGVLSTVDVGSTTPAGDGYQFYQGTSMAAPHVAGVAALMLARRSDLLPFELEVLMRSHARAFPAPCSGGCGTGLLDATLALNNLFLGASAGSRVAEVEPNDRQVTGQALAAQLVTVDGSVSPTKDLDIYKVAVPAGATLKLRLIGNAESNYNLELRTLAGALLLASQRAAGYTDTITWVNRSATAVDVYPRVVWVSGGTGPVLGRYALESALSAAPAAPSTPPASPPASPPATPPATPTPVTEVEPNDRQVSAQVLSDARSLVSGYVSPAKDLDIYKVSLPAGATVTVTLTPTTGANHDLELRTLAGVLLTSNKKAGSSAETLSWTNRGSTPTDVYPRVTWVSGGTGPSAGAYSLLVSR